MSWIARQARTGQFRRRASKWHNDGGAERGGNVHWTAVIRQHGSTRLKQNAEVTESRASGQIPNKPLAVTLGRTGVGGGDALDPARNFSGALHV
jgi:hypothetical protein